MEKYSIKECSDLFLNFINLFKCIQKQSHYRKWLYFYFILAGIFFFPFSLVIFVFCELLLFLRITIRLLWKEINLFLESFPKDHWGIKIPLIIIFGWIILSVQITEGFMHVCVFGFGFFYDIFNKGFSLGKSETYFIEI